MPDAESAKAYAYERLMRDLPPTRVYHSLNHTLTVVAEAQQLSALSGLSSEDTVLLQTAAYFHDIGFIEQQQEHEIVGVRMVRAILPQFHYTENEMTLIAGMIMATRLPQTPHTFLEELLADADLAILGRESFLECNRALRREAEVVSGEAISDQRWYTTQYTFMKDHRYFTQAAAHLYPEQKRRNLSHLYELARPYL